MFKIADKIEDTLNDNIGKILKQLLEIPTYTKAKKLLHLELIELLKKGGYYEFVGHPSKYHLSRVGESCFYDVHPNRRGHLKKFRNKRVRLICVSSGRYDRLLMAKDVISAKG